MFRRSSLSASHYAGNWAIPDESQRIDLAVTNQIALAYGIEADGPAKEALLLHLLQNFHGYSMKYLVMVVRGTLPHLNSPVGREAKEFLRMLAPKGSEFDLEQFARCCIWHLSSRLRKRFTTRLVFFRAVRKFDPRHTETVRVVCEGIDAEKDIDAEELAARVGFDCAGILRALVRNKLLTSVIGKKRKSRDTNLQTHPE